jgi:hypothetical protein
VSRCVTFALGFLALLARGALADGLRLDVRMENPSVLQYEHVVAFLTLYNDTAQPLVIDESAGKVRVEFLIRNDAGDTTAKYDDSRVVGSLVVKADSKEETMVELSDFYDMRHTGRYLVSAGVTWNGTTYNSDSRVVEVVTGLEITSASKSVPGYPNHQRTYSLKYSTRNHVENLFLVVSEEPSKMNYGVFCLGPLVRVNKPQIDVDRSGRVHILHQQDGDVYVHSYFQSDRDGVQFVDHRYVKENGDPISTGPVTVKPEPASTNTAPPAGAKPAKKKK